MIINPQSGSNAAFVFGELGDGTITFPRPAKAVIVDRRTNGQMQMRGAFLLLPGSYAIATSSQRITLSSDGTQFTCPSDGTAHSYFAILE